MIYIDPLESIPSPFASTFIVPPLILISPLEFEPKPFCPGLPFKEDESLPPAAFIPSSLATTLILPSFKVIFSPSIPSYDLEILILPAF